MRSHIVVLTMAFCLSFVAGCSTTNRGFSKPDLSYVRIGMAKQEVIDSLGKPDSVAAQGRTEYLGYGWDKFMDGIVGSAEWYYVRLVDGKVESFGPEEMPRELTIKERMLLCGGNAACETAVIEEFRADEARRNAAIGIYQGLQSQRQSQQMEAYQRQADRVHRSFDAQLQRIPPPGSWRDNQYDIYLHHR